MSKNETIRHHTVPVCYLANFGVNGNQGRDSQVYYCNMQKGMYGLTSIEHIPVENYFYNVEELGEHKQIIEKWFCEIEGELSTLLKHILNTININPENRNSDIFNISKDNRGNLSAQMAMQITRTSEFRSGFSSIYEQLKEGLPFASIPGCNKSGFRRIHNLEILSCKMSNFYANLFSDRHFLFLVNHTDVPFITSDNPVITIDHRINKEEPTSAISKELTYYYPISPNIAIEVYDKNILKTDMLYYDVFDSKVIASYNGQILQNSTRFLISNTNLNPNERRDYE